MKPPEEVLRELVGQWTAKAESDYRAARQLIQSDEPIREAVAFHCQQAAEKYVKALLVRHQVEFPKTHDIKELLDLLARIEPDLADSLLEASWLTPFGVEVRYPSDSPEMLPSEGRQAVELARRVREAVMASLGPYLSAG
jgi:HEPN domain-containing protein